MHIITAERITCKQQRQNEGCVLKIHYWPAAIVHKISVILIGFAMEFLDSRIIHRLGNPNHHGMGQALAVCSVLFGESIRYKTSNHFSSTFNLRNGLLRIIVNRYFK